MSLKSKVAATAVVASLASGTPALANEAVGLIASFYEKVDASTSPTEDLSAFFSDDFVDHNRPAAAPEGAPDRGVALNLFTELKIAFPDGSHTLDMLHAVSPDTAMVYWTFEGTHLGPFFGGTASGNRVSINGIDIFKVRDGQFVEQWHVEELASLFEQISPQ